MILSGLISWLTLVLVVSLIYWVLSQFAPPQIMKIVLVVCVVVIVIGLIYLLLPLLHLSAVR